MSAAPTLATTVGSTPDAARSVWALRWRRFLGHKGAVIALVVLALLLAFALSAPLLEWYLGIDAFKANILRRLKEATDIHWLGTDELGRDILARLMYGGQISLLVGVSAAVSASILGTVIGLSAGYFGGKLDSALMRLTDGVIALPLVPLLVVFAAIDLQKLGFSETFARSGEASIIRIIVIITLIQWTTVARLVRAATLSVREREFVLAAQAQGASSLHIMTKHVLPNVVSPIIVATTLSIGQVILFESTLSFLGLGIQPPTPSWGNMLSNAQDFIATAPMLAILPGLFIFVTVIAVNFVGDGLQDAFDPKADPR